MGVPFTFIHAADLHLDSPFKGLSEAPDAVRARLRESTFRAMRGIVDLALREAADFVVIAGDLYDAADRSLRAQLRLQAMLAELAAANVGVFLVHGNHDPDSGRSARLDWPAGVRAFGSDGVACAPAYRRDGQLAAYLYGISYPSPAVTDNLALRFAKREGAPFHLALLHANVDGDPAHDNYAPCRLDELIGSGFDYWALGHVHTRRILHEYPHVVYPGNPQGRSVRETGPRGAYAVRVSETGSIEMSFRDTADTIWTEKPVSIAGAEREQELKERLLAAAEEARAEASGRPVVLRLRLTGRGPLHETLLHDAVAEEWLGELRDWLGAPETREDWVWAESLAIRTGSDLDPAAWAGEEGFLGAFVRRGLQAAEDPETGRQLASGALEALRKQPALRGWLAARSDAEYREWILRAMEKTAAMLRDDDTG